MRGVGDRDLLAGVRFVGLELCLCGAELHDRVVEVAGRNTGVGREGAFVRNRGGDRGAELCGGRGAEDVLLVRRRQHALFFLRDGDLLALHVDADHDESRLRLGLDDAGLVVVFASNLFLFDLVRDEP